MQTADCLGRTSEGFLLSGPAMAVGTAFIGGNYLAASHKVRRGDCGSFGGVANDAADVTAPTSATFRHPTRHHRAVFK